MHRHPVQRRGEVDLPIDSCSRSAGDIFPRLPGSITTIMECIIMTTTTRLYASYEDRHLVKSLGARFLPRDDGGPYWYVPSGRDLAPFSAWLKQPVPVSVSLGSSLAGVVELFATAASSLKHPRIILRAGETDIKLYRAKKGKAPGSINVVTRHGQFGVDQVWFGRIDPASGEFETSARGRGHVDFDAVVDILKALAADASATASAYGHASGSCCFCSRELTHVGSLQVGYGPICAASFGLPHSY